MGTRRGAQGAARAEALWALSPGGAAIRGPHHLGTWSNTPRPPQETMAPGPQQPGQPHGGGQVGVEVSRGQHRPWLRRLTQACSGTVKAGDSCGDPWLGSCGAAGKPLLPAPAQPSSEPLAAMGGRARGGSAAAEHDRGAAASSASTDHLCSPRLRQLLGDPGLHPRTSEGLLALSITLLVTPAGHGTAWTAGGSQPWRAGSSCSPGRPRRACWVGILVQHKPTEAKATGMRSTHSQCVPEPGSGGPALLLILLPGPPGWLVHGTLWSRGPRGHLPEARQRLGQRGQSPPPERGHSQ